MTLTEQLLIPLINYIRQNSRYSRRDAQQNIISGNVSVNGVIVTDTKTLISSNDKVMVGNQKIKSVTKRYYMFHKPVGVISTYKDPKSRRDLESFVRKFQLDASIRPIGRLDRDSSGLLLFSNDGDFINQILHPRFSIKKTYDIRLDAPLDSDDMSKISTGFFLDDGPVQINFEDVTTPSHFTVSISMGRNRILRRAFEYFGYTVTYLHRISIGHLMLGPLSSGTFAQIKKEDIKRLVDD